MLEKIIDRPMVFFDVETTGPNPDKDRIVQFAGVKLLPTTIGGTERGALKMLVNPGVPIPAGATAVHGIVDADVKDAPPFKQVLAELEGFFDGADLAGFNIVGFDIQIMDAEFRRCGRDGFDLRGRRIVDAMEIFHRLEPRNLESALRFYCGKMHTNAHDALFDVHATIEVLEAQHKLYAVLPRSIEGLSAWCRGDRVTFDKKVVWGDDGEACFAFGKHKGEALRKVAKAKPDYFRWLLGQEFSSETKAVFWNALKGVFPERFLPNGQPQDWSQP